MRLSSTEYEIMEIIWSKGGCVTSQDICELSKERNWKAPTVLTFLKRLCEKGILTSEKRGKLRYYTPLISKDTYAQTETKAFIDELYGGSFSNLIAAMAGHADLTEDDREELKKLLDGDWK